MPEEGGAKAAESLGAASAGRNAVTEVPGESMAEARRDDAVRPVAVSPPVAVPAPLPAAAASGRVPESFGFRRVVVVLMAAIVVAGLVGTSLSRRVPASDLDGPGRVRLSRHVTREEPGLVRKLLGARPRLHVTAPEGTLVRVRLETPLSSETAESGQEFTGTTIAALVIDGVEALPPGSRVKGHVSHAAEAGNVSQRGDLTLEADRISAPGGPEMAVEAGGSAGTGVVPATRSEEVILAEGSSLEFRLRSPLVVTKEAASR
jgi:hypothetical protein